MGGDPLVDLDPRDFEVALAQAKAQLSQAENQVTAQRPNVPITQVENTTNISTGESGVANAQAALGAAEHDRDTSVARLSEAEANSAKAQSDLARYKILIANEEVSQQEYDQIAATAQAQAANVSATKASVASANQIVDQRRAQLEEARSRLAQYQQNAPRQVAMREDRSALAAIQRGDRPSSSGTGSIEIELYENRRARLGHRSPPRRRTGRACGGGPATADDRANRGCVGHSQLQGNPARQYQAGADGQNPRGCVEAGF